MIQLQIARIVKYPVASLATGAILREKKLIHLRTAHLFSFRLSNTLFDPKKWCGIVAFVGSLRWFVREMNLTKQANMVSQSVDYNIMNLFPYIYPYPFAFHAFGGNESCCASGKKGQEQYHLHSMMLE